MSHQPSPYSATPSPVPDPPRSYEQGRADERARWERVLKHPLAVAHEVRPEVVLGYLAGKDWRSCRSLVDGLAVYRTDDAQGPAEVMAPSDAQHPHRSLVLVRAAETVADVERRSREAVLLDWLDATEANCG